jgi:hypothetical protein
LGKARYVYVLHLHTIERFGQDGKIGCPILQVDAKEIGARQHQARKRVPHTHQTRTIPVRLPTRSISKHTNHRKATKAPKGHRLLALSRAWISYKSLVSHPVPLKVCERIMSSSAVHARRGTRRGRCPWVRSRGIPRSPPPHRALYHPLRARHRCRRPAPEAPRSARLHTGIAGTRVLATPGAGGGPVLLRLNTYHIHIARLKSKRGTSRTRNRGGWGGTRNKKPNARSWKIRRGGAVRPAGGGGVGL